MRTTVTMWASAGSCQAWREPSCACDSPCWKYRCAGMVLHNILSLNTAAWQCFDMLLGMHTIVFGSRGSRAGVMLFCRQGTDLICSRSAMLVCRLSTSSHILPCASCACCCILMLQAKLSSVQDSLKAELHSLEQVG